MTAQININNINFKIEKSQKLHSTYQLRFFDYFPTILIPTRGSFNHIESLVRKDPKFNQSLILLSEQSPYKEHTNSLYIENKKKFIIWKESPRFKYDLLENYVIIYHNNLPIVKALDKLSSAISKDRLRNLIEETENKFFPEYKVSNIKISYKFQKLNSRWGSCHKIGFSEFTIKLNTFLIFYPRYIQEYVIVHELSHIKIPNHGKDFQNVLGNKIPTYKHIEKELKNFRFA